MAKKKRIDPIKQREKRAKIIAAVGGLLLVGVGFVEVPSVMKQMNAKPPVVAAAAPVVGTPDPGGSLSLPQVGAVPGAASSGDGLIDTDAPPVASGGGQLISFDAFEMKNPFTPQVSGVSTAPVDPSNPPDPNPTAVAPATGATATPTSTTSTAITPMETLTGTPPLASPAGTTPATTTPTPATTSTVAISVNGTVSRVGKAGTFPAGAPVFRLASWQHGSAEISIVGGSYAVGGETLTLHLNKPVTLQNTHDGKQYKLVLVSTP